MRKALALVLFVLVLFQSDAQEQLRVSPYEGSLKDFIELAEKENEVKFLFKENWIKGIELNYDGQKDLKLYLADQIQKKGLSILFRDKFIFIIPSNPLIYVETDELYSKLGDDIKIVGETPDQDFEYASVEFITRNGSDQSVLLGAQLYAEEVQQGGVTDGSGRIMIQLPPGFHTIKTNHLGYEETELFIFVKGDGKVELDLFEQSRVLDEVTISTQNAERNVDRTLMGVNTMTLELVKRLPAIYGEVDVVKSLELLPGVSTAGEGTQGFTVRGGNTDQNLLLLDGATIYNASHLFGFFSNINSDFVGSATLYKSSIPPKYGGRASSVLSVTTKEPNFKDLKLKLGVGFVSSKAFADIPLIEDKLGLMVAGRVSYANWILKSQNNVQVLNSRGNFNDMNLKAVYRVSDSDKLTISGYNSFDEFKFAADTSYGWKTQTGSLIWDHIFNKRLSLQAQAGFSDYKFTIAGLSDPFVFDLENGISNGYGNAQLYYDYSAKLKLEAGIEYKKLTINPGVLALSENNPTRPVDLQKEYADLSSTFAQFEYQLSPRVQTESGIRITNYRYLGVRSVNLYATGTPRNENTVIGQQEYADGEVIQSYFNVEPRVALRLTLGLNSSLKVSYNRNHQFLHSLSTTSSITPIEIWKASDQFLPPLRNDQFSIGLFKNLLGGQYETSIEFYYRELTNLIDYKNGSSILLNPSMEQAILVGDGIGYGSELYIKKNIGKLTGWLSYAYSRTQKRIVSDLREETVNNGQLYPSEFDRPHNISLVGSYQLSRRLAFGVNFTYITGLPFTGPEERYFSNGDLITYFSQRNQYRIPDYHRLDLSITVDESLRTEKKLKGSWIFSFFNVYGRRNAYSIFLGQRNTSLPVANQLAILGRLFPSVTYNLRIE